MYIRLVLLYKFFVYVSELANKDHLCYINMKNEKNMMEIKNIDDIIYAYSEEFRLKYGKSLEEVTDMINKHKYNSSDYSMCLESQAIRAKIYLLQRFGTKVLEEENLKDLLESGKSIMIMPSPSPSRKKLIVK